MNWQSILVAVLVAAILVAIIVKVIVNKKRGKGSCSCGGNCGACGMCNSDKTLKK